MRYLYGAADEKFVKGKQSTSNKNKNPLQTYQFRVHEYLKGKQKFDHNALPIIFKVSPDTLLNLAAKVVDSIPLTPVYSWSNVDVCTWIRRYGYPQYQNTFKENLVNGRTLLLLDAAALSAMNIKNFDDMRHIAYGIRALFHFEMTKFARSISLAPQYHYELYKLFRVKSGRRFELTRRSDLWRQLQLMRPKSPNLSHWELLERWLALEPQPEQPELFGGVRRFKLYKCKQQQAVAAPPSNPHNASRCNCLPPCDCYWGALDVCVPWRFSCLLPREPEPPVKQPCNCIPPCTCHWSSKKFMDSTVLNSLHNAFPQKYGELGHHTTVTESIRNSKLRRLMF